LTGLPVGRVSFYLKKIQNGIVLVKKINGLQLSFLLGFAGLTRQVSPVTLNHEFFYFFINPTRFQFEMAR
jgi:hypothetical protein